ncbi:hypothetical protein A6302_03943 [Methylobrevis pamukkalensis]|uniref:Uncharacterized protein n=1 Tax=Methylobrevis pamukkalensis TaxID=1439726 RepID=A0A1E3GXE1_9HYPH|nr:hypothetical protein A6302_03943 [Methylobrevis pamukkalensis]
MTRRLLAGIGRRRGAVGRARRTLGALRTGVRAFRTRLAPLGPRIGAGVCARVGAGIGALRAIVAARRTLVALGARRAVGIAGAILIPILVPVAAALAIVAAVVARPFLLATILIAILRPAILTPVLIAVLGTTILIAILATVVAAIAVVVAIVIAAVVPVVALVVAARLILGAVVAAAAAAGLLGRRLAFRIAAVEAVVALAVEVAVAIEVAGEGRPLRIGDDAVIVLGVLEIVLRHHAVAGRRGITRKLGILFRDMQGRSANLHVRTVGIEALGQRVHALAVVVRPAPRTLLAVLSLPHNDPLSLASPISTTDGPLRAGRAPPLRAEERPATGNGKVAARVEVLRSTSFATFTRPSGVCSVSGDPVNTHSPERRSAFTAVARNWPTRLRWSVCPMRRTSPKRRLQPSAT